MMERLTLEVETPRDMRSARDRTNPNSTPRTGPKSITPTPRRSSRSSISYVDENNPVKTKRVSDVWKDSNSHIAVQELIQVPGLPSARASTSNPKESYASPRNSRVSLLSTPRKSQTFSTPELNIETSNVFTDSMKSTGSYANLAALASVSKSQTQRNARAIDQLLNGEFKPVYNLKRLEDVLGRGVSSMVFKSVMLDTLTICAEKVVVVSDQSKRIQLIRELKSLKAATKGNKEPCPYILQLYDVIPNPNDGTLSVCLEFMDGGSLQDLVKAGGTPDERVLHGISMQMLKGLAFLHGLRIIHRDLKPSNTLISSSGVCKLADFGLSKTLEEDNSLADSFVGTFYFMAPERMQGLMYSFQSDVWSLGLTVHTVARGMYPYQTKDGYWSLLSAIQDEPTPIPPTPPYSYEFADFIRVACTHDGTSRPTAKVMLDHSFITRLEDISPPASARPRKGSITSPRRPSDPKVGTRQIPGDMCLPPLNERPNQSGGANGLSLNSVADAGNRKKISSADDAYPAGGRARARSHSQASTRSDAGSSSSRNPSGTLADAVRNASTVSQESVIKVPPGMRYIPFPSSIYEPVNPLGTTSKGKSSSGKAGGCDNAGGADESRLNSPHGKSNLLPNPSKNVGEGLKATRQKSRGPSASGDDEVGSVDRPSGRLKNDMKMAKASKGRKSSAARRKKKVAGGSAMNSIGAGEQATKRVELPRTVLTRASKIYFKSLDNLQGPWIDHNSRVKGSRGRSGVYGSSISKLESRSSSRRLISGGALDNDDSMTEGSVAYVGAMNMPAGSQVSAIKRVLYGAGSIVRDRHHYQYRSSNGRILEPYDAAENCKFPKEVISIDNHGLSRSNSTASGASSFNPNFLNGAILSRASSRVKRSESDQLPSLAEHAPSPERQIITTAHRISRKRTLSSDNATSATSSASSRRSVKVTGIAETELNEKAPLATPSTAPMQSNCTPFTPYLATPQGSQSQWTSRERTISNESVAGSMVNNDGYSTAAGAQSTGAPTMVRRNSAFNITPSAGDEKIMNGGVGMTPGVTPKSTARKQPSSLSVEDAAGVAKAWMDFVIAATATETESGDKMAKTNQNLLDKISSIQNMDLTSGTKYQADTKAMSKGETSESDKKVAAQDTSMRSSMRSIPEDSSVTSPVPSLNINMGLSQKTPRKSSLKGPSGSSDSEAQLPVGGGGTARATARGSVSLSARINTGRAQSENPPSSARASGISRFSLALDESIKAESRQSIDNESYLMKMLTPKNTQSVEVLLNDGIQQRTFPATKGSMKETEGDGTNISPNSSADGLADGQPDGSASGRSVKVTSTGSVISHSRRGSTKSAIGSLIPKKPSDVALGGDFDDDELEDFEVEPMTPSKMLMVASTGKGQQGAMSSVSLTEGILQANASAEKKKDICQGLMKKLQIAFEPGKFEHLAHYMGCDESVLRAAFAKAISDIRELISRAVNDAAALELHLQKQRELDHQEHEEKLANRELQMQQQLDMKAVKMKSKVRWDSVPAYSFDDELPDIQHHDFEYSPPSQRTLQHQHSFPARRSSATRSLGHAVPKGGVAGFRSGVGMGQLNGAQVHVNNSNVSLSSANSTASAGTKYGVLRRAKSEGLPMEPLTVSSASGDRERNDGGAEISASTNASSPNRLSASRPGISPPKRDHPSSYYAKTRHLQFGTPIIDPLCEEENEDRVDSPQKGDARNPNLTLVIDTGDHESEDGYASQKGQSDANDGNYSSDGEFQNHAASASTSHKLNANEQNTATDDYEGADQVKESLFVETFTSVAGGIHGAASARAGTGNHVAATTRSEQELNELIDTFGGHIGGDVVFTDDEHSPYRSGRTEISPKISPKHRAAGGSVGNTGSVAKSADSEKDIDLVNPVLMDTERENYQADVDSHARKGHADRTADRAPVGIEGVSHVLGDLDVGAGSGGDDDDDGGDDDGDGDDYGDNDFENEASPRASAAGGADAESTITDSRQAGDGRGDDDDDDDDETGAGYDEEFESESHRAEEC